MGICIDIDVGLVPVNALDVAIDSLIRVFAKNEVVLKHVQHTHHLT